MINTQGHGGRQSAPAPAMTTCLEWIHAVADGIVLIVFYYWQSLPLPFCFTEGVLAIATI